MSVNEFDFITLRELILKMEGYKQARKAKEESLMFAIRWQTAKLMNATGNYKTAIEEKDLFVFDWEKPKQLARKVTEEERAVLLKWAEADKTKT